MRAPLSVGRDAPFGDGGLGSPAPMSPDPLAGRSSDFLFDRGGDLLDMLPQYLLVIGSPGRELECRMKLKSVGPPVCGSAHEDRHDWNASQRRERKRPKASARRVSEKGHEHALLAPGILIEQDDDFAAGVECSNDAESRPTHRNLFENRLLTGRLQGQPTKPEHRAVESGLVQTSINDRNRNPTRRGLRTCELPVSEMCSDDQHSTRRRLPLCFLQIFETLDLNALEQCGALTTSQQYEFGESSTQMDENFARPAFAFGDIVLGKREFHLLSNATSSRATQPMPGISEACAQRDRRIDREPLEGVTECREKP